MILDDRFYPVTKKCCQRLSTFCAFRFEIGFVAMKAGAGKLKDEYLLRLPIIHMAVLGMVE